MQTFSEENYLKIIFHLEKEGARKITPTAISEALSNNPASVVDMLKKLTEKGLIEYEKSKGVKLLTEGRQIAVSVVRKHRLWEAFLLEKLGYGWDEIHEIAEQLEHVKAPGLADRLDKFLGYPQYDPHGEAIPDARGETRAIEKKYLASISEGCTLKVVSVKDTVPAFLQYLKKLDIGIGARITIAEKIPFDNSMVLKLEDDREVTVSEIFAQNVLVQEV